VVNLADCLVELLQGESGHSFEGEIVPVKNTALGKNEKW